MDNIDKIFFKAINGQALPHFFDPLFMYLHGISSVEIVFFLFCFVLFSIVISAPKRGPRAAIAVFIASMSTFFGAESLRDLILRPYPFAVMDPSDMNLRVGVVKGVSAFPVLSNLMFGTVAMAIIFYFPKHAAAILIASVFYAFIPIYLGVSYPFDAFGSLLVGFLLGYVQMVILSRLSYFGRYH